MKALNCILLIAATVGAGSLLTAVAVNRRPMAVSVLTPGEQRFRVRGEIRSVDAGAMSVQIKHEAIPGYMAAMTMPFDVRDRALLRGFKPGDIVSFDLIVTKEDSWIAGMRKLSIADHGAADPKVAENPARVRTGGIVPDFQLLDQHGRRVRLSDYRGKAVVLTFIYTRCPLPNFCPLMSKNFAALQERLESAFPGKYQLLSVTIDPQFDRPEVLKEYAARYTGRDGTWTFATGAIEETDAVGALFGLIQERSGGLINHDLRTALIGPDGRLEHIWKSNAWTPYEIQRRIEALLQ